MWSDPRAAGPHWKPFSMQRRPRTITIALLLTAVGLLVSLDLMRLHYKVHTDPSYHSFCAMSDTFNCQTVAESQYAVFAGMPIAAWGALGYAGLLVLLAASWSSGLSAPGLLAALLFSAAAVGCSVTLAVI